MRRRHCWPSWLWWCTPLCYQRAPIVVGHGLGGLLACMFGAPFTARAVVTVEQRLDLPATTDPDPVGCGAWPSGQVLGDLLRQGRAPLLSVFGEPPEAGYAAWLSDLVPTSRCLVYGPSRPPTTTPSASPVAARLPCGWSPFFTRRGLHS